MALCAGGFVLHELTVYADLKWSIARRHIAAGADGAHRARDAAPGRLGAARGAHWDQIAGAGTAPVAFAPSLKAVPLPGAYLATALAACAVVTALYLEELIRCMRIPGRVGLKSPRRARAPHD